MTTVRAPIWIATALAAVVLALFAGRPAHAGDPRPAPALDAAPVYPGGDAKADGGIAGGNGCPCVYRLDDGTGEQNLGVAGDDEATVAMANAFLADASCPDIDLIQVAWGEMPAGAPVVLAIYDDPNNDGDPSDVTAADRVAVTTGVTANEGTDELNGYPIAPADVAALGVFFVVAITADTGTDRPLRLDSGSSTGSSWFATSFTDPDDPFQTGGVGLVDTFGFPGSFMLRATGRLRGSCPTDLDASGGTDVDDLIAVILDWNCGVQAPADCGTCSGDADGDADTDVDDLISIVLAWGACPVANDTCAEAPYVLGGSGVMTPDTLSCAPVSTAFGNVGAVLDGAAPSCAPAAPADVWFRYVADCNGAVVIDTDGSGFDTVLEVWSGPSCAAATLLACDDDSGADGADSRVVVTGLRDGEELLIRVAGGPGAGVLNVCCALEVADNDACVGAIPLSAGLTSFSTESATTDGPAHPECSSYCDGGVTRNDIWFTYVADCGGPAGQPAVLTISTCEEIGGSATYDTDLVIYDPSFVAADVCDDLAGALLACNDDDPLNACGTQDPFHSRIEVPVVQGRQYLIRVGGWGGIGDGIDVGTGELFVDCAATDDDECAFATPIAVGGTVQLDTCSATVDDLAPACGITPPDEPGRWVVVTGTGNDLTVSLCNLNDGNFPDTRLSVYIGGAGPAVDCSNLRCVDDEPNDNNPNCPFTEELTWCSAAGVQYLVLVHGQGSPGCGLIDVTVEEGGPCSAPAGLALGACCLAGGSCVNDLADVACLAMGGTPFAGDGCPAVACPCEDAGITLQQHAVDFPIDDVVRCAPGASQADNWYYRQLTASDGLPSTFDACAVELAIYEAAAAPGTDGTPITVCLYDVPIASLTFGPGGTTTTTAIGCTTFVVTDAMAGAYQRVPIAGTTTTGILTVEVFTPSGVAGPFQGNILTLGDNDCGEIPPTSSFVRAPFCGVTAPVPLPGAPGMLLWKVHGE